MYIARPTNEAEIPGPCIPGKLRMLCLTLWYKGLCQQHIYVTASTKVVSWNDWVLCSWILQKWKRPVCFVACPASGGGGLVWGHQGWRDAAGPAWSPLWAETGEPRSCSYGMWSRCRLQTLCVLWSCWIKLFLMIYVTVLVLLYCMCCTRYRPNTVHVKQGKYLICFIIIRIEQEKQDYQEQIRVHQHKHNTKTQLEDFTCPIWPEVFVFALLIRVFIVKPRSD